MQGHNDKARYSYSHTAIVIQLDLSSHVEPWLIPSGVHDTTHVHTIPTYQYSINWENTDICLSSIQSQKQSITVALFNMYCTGICTVPVYMYCTIPMYMYCTSVYILYQYMYYTSVYVLYQCVCTVPVYVLYQCIYTVPYQCICTVPVYMYIYCTSTVIYCTSIPVYMYYTSVYVLYQCVCTVPVYVLYQCIMYGTSVY